jgi:hypothetical protein
LSIMVVIGGSLAVIGLAVAVLAHPLATSQEHVVHVLPGPFKKFYRVIGAGMPFDSPPWVAYNRIAGLLLALFGTMVAVFAAMRP